MIHHAGGFAAADNRTVGTQSENAAGPQKYYPHMRGNNKVAL